MKALWVSRLLDRISQSVGSILIRGESGWEALPPGPSGMALVSRGPGNLPAWSPIETSGGMIWVPADLMRTNGGKSSGGWGFIEISLLDGSNHYAEFVFPKVVSGSFKVGFIFHISSGNAGNMVFSVGVKYVVYGWFTDWVSTSNISVYVAGASGTHYLPIAQFSGVSAPSDAMATLIRITRLGTSPEDTTNAHCYVHLAFVS